MNYREYGEGYMSEVDGNLVGIIKHWLQKTLYGFATGSPQSIWVIRTFGPLYFFRIKHVKDRTINSEKMVPWCDLKTWSQTAPWVNQSWCWYPHWNGESGGYSIEIFVWGNAYLLNLLTIQHFLALRNSKIAGRSTVNIEIETKNHYGHCIKAQNSICAIPFLQIFIRGNQWDRIFLQWPHWKEHKAQNSIPANSAPVEMR